MQRSPAAAIAGAHAAHPWPDPMSASGKTTMWFLAPTESLHALALALVQPVA